tara:strand:- start:11185 stop:14307 length:3123 start_codon:yes stop_codon:yes gene_type:complete
MSGIKGITLTAAGTDYTSVPTVTIASGLVLNIKVRENKSSRNVQSFAGSNFANHIGTVQGAADATTVTLREGVSTTDDAYNGCAIYIYEGTGAGQILTISDYVGSTRVLTTSTASPVLDATSKYYIGPAVTISGGGGSGATAAAIANEDGSIASIVVVNQGSGYTSTPSVSFAGQGRLLVEGGSFQTTSVPEVIVEISEGAGATAVAKLVGTGVKEINITNGGEQYDAVPTIVIESVNGEGSGATATCTLSGKVINGVTLTNAGSGYTEVPTVKVIPAQVDLLDSGASGTGNEVRAAVLVAALANTEVDSIKMTCFGGGYREPPLVTISGGGGSGATARAVLKDDNINARIKGEPPLKLVKSPKPEQNLLMGLTPFPSFVSGRRQAMRQIYKTGSLVMMKDGLYRVTGAESISYSAFMGIEMEITAFDSRSPTVKVVDGDFDCSGSQSVANVAIPKGTILVFGDDGDTQETVKLKADILFDSSNLTRAISFVSPTTLDSAISATTNSSLTNTYKVGDKVTAMFIPGHRGLASMVGVSNLKTFSQIEPLGGSTKISGDSSFYHMALGIGAQPKFISAAGAFTNAGFSDITTLNDAGTTVLGQPSRPQPEPELAAEYIVPWDSEAHDPTPPTGHINPVSTLSTYCSFDNLSGQQPPDNENKLLIEIPAGGNAQALLDLAVGTVVKFTIPQSGKTLDYFSSAANALVADPLTIVRKVTGIKGGIKSSSGREYVELSHAGYASGVSTLTLDAAAGEIGDFNGSLSTPARPDLAVTNAPMLIGGFPLTILSAAASAGDGGVKAVTNSSSLAGTNYASGQKRLQIGGGPSDDAGLLAGTSLFSLEMDKGVVVGGTGRKSLVGFISPRIRVFQPAGTPLWSIQEASRSTDDFLKEASGWIDSSDSPAGAPNPMFSLFMGTGEEQSPRFQFLNVDEDLRIPIIVLTGWKYRLREVPEDEVRNMIRRSGRFNYEIVPYAQSNFQKGQDPSGPVGGWHTHVKKHRGRKMSFEEYKASIGQTTDMTNNILAGSKSGMGKSRRDPRASYRRY